MSRRLGWGQEGRIYGPLLGSGGGRGRRFGMDGKGGGEGSIHCTAPKFFCYLNHFNHFSVCQLFVVQLTMIILKNHLGPIDKGPGGGGSSSVQKFMLHCMSKAVWNIFGNSSVLVA